VAVDVQDGRSLSAEAKEALRKRAVRAVLEGATHEEAATLFGVARGTVTRWMKQYDAQGEAGLAAKRIGRPPQPTLSEAQATLITDLVCRHPPDELGLPFHLWTREAVGQLIERECGVFRSVWTVGRYLRQWGLSPQKPVRKAFEQDPQAVTRWLEEEYPTVEAEAKREGAEIHWGDEVGMRSDHQAGQTWGKRGQAPVVSGTGKRFRGNAILSLTNQGTLRFRVFQGSFDTAVFVDFLWRLIRDRERKVYLIVDRHSVHVGKETAAWVERHREAVRLVFLPTYSPDLNPAEYLNQDLKTNAVGRRRPRNAGELLGNVRSYLHSTQKRPGLVRRYFLAPSVRYAAE
jgi:transposase